MIEIMIHVPSVFIGVIAGIVIMGAFWIWTAVHDDGAFSRGWDCGYKYGKSEAEEENADHN